MPCNVLSLLTMPVLGSPECEWLLWFAVFQVCWQYLSLPLQDVSGCYALPCFKPANNACPWLFSMWVAAVLCRYFKPPANNACPWLSRMWVVAVPCSVSSLWQCLPLALQRVSGFFALRCFKPANNACPWLFSMWVAAVPCNVSSLLTISVLCSSVGEWLLCLHCFKLANSARWLSRRWVTSTF